MKTLILTEAGLDCAYSVIKGGGLAAVPTETVYGLSADGLNPDAVERIYAVKGRPETKPINLLVSGMDSVRHFCRDIPDDAYTYSRRLNRWRSLSRPQAHSEAS